MYAQRDACCSAIREVQKLPRKLHNKTVRLQYDQNRSVSLTRNLSVTPISELLTYISYVKRLVAGICEGVCMKAT